MKTSRTTTTPRVRGPRGLRLPKHRCPPTADTSAIYPFHAEAGLGPNGVYLGTDVLTGGGVFCFDPFAA